MTISALQIVIYLQHIQVGLIYLGMAQVVGIVGSRLIVLMLLTVTMEVILIKI